MYIIFEWKCSKEFNPPPPTPNKKKKNKNKNKNNAVKREPWEIFVDIPNMSVSYEEAYYIAIELYPCCFKKMTYEWFVLPSFRFGITCINYLYGNSHLLVL